MVVTADDVTARDLARELAAYLAPRRVRHYPSRGTGYASHVAPPPHLVGLRIAALDALTGRERGRAAPSSSQAPSPWPRPSRTPPFAPRASPSGSARRSTCLLSPSSWPRRDTSGSTRSRSAGSSPCAAASSTSSAQQRTARRAWSSSATRSSRSAGSRPSRSARWARHRGLELSPAAELASEHRMLAEAALADDHPEAGSGAIDCLPVDSFRAPLDVIAVDVAFVIAVRRGDRDRASLALGGRDGRDALRRRAAALRGRRGAARRARGAAPSLDWPGRRRPRRSARRRPLQLLAR